MGHFDYKKYQEKAEKRRIWEEKVKHYGLEVAKIINKNPRLQAQAAGSAHANAELINKRHKVPSKEDL